MHFEIKVADLGLSIENLGGSPLFLKCGTPGYIAPEMFLNKGYGYKVDVFSAGSLFFNLLTGYSVFNGDTPEELILNNRLCRTERIIPNIKKFSIPCQQLLMQMLDKDPEKRPSAKEALGHDWFL